LRVLEKDLARCNKFGLVGYNYFASTPLVVTMSRPSLDVGSGWLALRDTKNPSLGWYFYHKANKKTQFTCPSSLPLLQHLPDVNDLFGLSVYLDGELRTQKPELAGQITPLQSAAEFFARRNRGGEETKTEQEEAKKVVLKIGGEKKEVDPRIEAARSQFGSLFLFESTPSRPTPLSAVAAEPLFGPGSWTHEFSVTGSPTDKAIQAISSSILASAPSFKDDSQVMRDWQSLVTTCLSKPDAIHEGDTLQRLSSLSDLIGLDPGARCAMAYILAAGARFSTFQTSLILNAFDEHSGDSSALIRSVSIFANRYSSQAGQSLVRSGETTKWMTPLLAIIKDAQWRRTLIELSNRASSNFSPDPFLDIAISTIAEGSFSKEVAGAAALAADTSFTESLSTSILSELGLSPAFSRSFSLAPAITSEISALLASFALAKFSERVKKSEQASCYLLDSNFSLRIDGLREELGFGILQKDCTLSSSLSVLPADADVMQEAAAYAPELNVGFTESTVRGVEGEESSSIFDACLQLRKASLHFFIVNGGRDDFFPEMTLGSNSRLENSPLSSAGLSSKDTTVPLSSLLNDINTLTADVSMSGDLSLDSQQIAPNVEMEASSSVLSGDLRIKLNCAKALDNDSVLEVVRALDVLKGAQFDLQMIAELKTRKSEVDALKNSLVSKFVEDVTGDENIQEAALNAKLSHAIDSILLAFALTARTLCNVDVLTLLLHLSMSPSVSLGSSTETVASALSWAINVASVPSVFHDKRRTDIGRIVSNTVFLGSSEAIGMKDSLHPSNQEILKQYEKFGTALIAVNNYTHSKSGLLTKFKKVSTAFPPPDDLENVEDIEAQLCCFGLSHPAIAVGLVHWMKHVSLSMLSQQETQSCARSFPIFARMSVAFCHRWPMTIQVTLDLLKLCLGIQSKMSNEATLVKTTRLSIADSLMSLFESTGFQVLIVQFCIDYCHSGGDIEILRLFVTKICQSLDTSSSTYSLFSYTFATVFSRLLLSIQKRIFVDWDSGTKRSDVMSISRDSDALRNFLFNASLLIKSNYPTVTELKEILVELEKGVV